MPPANLVVPPAKRDATAAPLFVRDRLGNEISGGSGECGLPFMTGNEQLVAGLSREHIVLLVQPGQLSFQVTHSPLEAAHLIYHTGIRPADVAE
jgi:hypothetical protein